MAKTEIKVLTSRPRKGRASGSLGFVQNVLAEMMAGLKSLSISKSVTKPSSWW